MKQKSPLPWIVSLYFAQGLPYAVVTLLAVVMYKTMHMSNTDIALYTSLLVIPWSLKPLWSPWLETLASKRNMTITSEFALAIVFIGIAISIPCPERIQLTLIIFVFLAFAGATQDITSDGVYLVNLDTKSQARYVGIRNMFYQLARFFCQGALIVLAGYLIKRTNDIYAWVVIFILLACVFFIIALYHFLVLPRDIPVKKKVNHFKNLYAVFKEFMRLPHIVNCLIFLLIFNFAESQLVKIVPLFLLDQYRAGGMHLSTSDVGFIVGTIGILFMVMGGITSGWLISKVGIIKGLPPLTLLTVIVNISYVWLAYHIHTSYIIVAILIAAAQFGFGLSNSAYMAYLLRKTNRGPNKMSVYAFGTAFMAIGMIIPGAISGIMQHTFGYELFFIWVLAVNFLIYIYTIYTVRNDGSLQF